MNNRSYCFRFLICRKNIFKNISKIPTLKLLDIQHNSIAKSGASEIYSLKNTNQRLKILFHGNQIANVSEIDAIDKRSKLNNK